MEEATVEEKPVGTIYEERSESLGQESADYIDLPEIRLEKVLNILRDSDIDPDDREFIIKLVQQSQNEKYKKTISQMKHDISLLMKENQDKSERIVNGMSENRRLELERKIYKEKAEWLEMFLCSVEHLEKKAFSKYIDTDPLMMREFGPGSSSAKFPMTTTEAKASTEPLVSMAK